MTMKLMAAVAAAGLALVGTQTAQAAETGGRDLPSEARHVQHVQAPRAGSRALAPTTEFFRVFGANRYETSAWLSESYWTEDVLKDSQRVVFVAAGTGFADGLAAGAAAGQAAAPLMLVPSTGTLPASTVAELKRIKPNAIVIAGGTPSVSADIEKQLLAFVPSKDSLYRYGGVNRYDTAALLAADYEEKGKTVYLASGEAFPDALAASAVANRDALPLLLTKRASLPEQTAKQLTRLAPAKVVVVGGEPSISAAVVAEVKKAAPSAAVDRIAGPNRYATAANLSKASGYAPGYSFVVSGENFPDALSASAAAGLDGAPMLLTRKGCLPKETDAELTRLTSKEILLVGGPTTISDAILTKTC